MVELPRCRGTSEINPSVREHVRVREVMNSPVITASPDETAKEAAERMTECRVGSVIVIEGDKPVGIVTDGDLVSKVVAKGRKPDEVKVREIMSGPLVTIKDETNVTEAARLMRKAGVKRLGVIHNHKLVGIVSISDVISVTPEIYAIVSEKARMLTDQYRSKTSHLAGFCDSCGEWSDYLAHVEGRYICYDCRAEGASEEISEET